MKWATFKESQSDIERVGLIEDQDVYALRAGITLPQLLGDDGAKLREAATSAKRDPEEILALDRIRLLPPITRPPAVRDFMSFQSHVEASFASRNLEIPSVFFREPVFYFTNPRALVGANDDIPMPPGTNCLDFEFEIAAIIGRDGHDLRPDEALKHIAGFCIFNDWSARDLQRQEMAMGIGPSKGKDSASTLGPWLITPDEIEPWRTHTGYDLEMTVLVNGQEYGRDRWSSALWDFGDLVAHASRGTWVSVGDVIASGTCGSGCLVELRYRGGEERFPWLKVGDKVTMDLEGVGQIGNLVVEGSNVIQGSQIAP